MLEVDFTGNYCDATDDGAARAMGGAVFFSSNYHDLNRCRFDGNSVEGNTPEYARGGAVYGYNSARPSFLYSEFANNTATRGGAHFYESNCEPFLIGTALRGNSAIESGGAFYSESATPYILNCAFQGNAAPDGGAIKTTGSGTSLPYIVDVEFCGNTVDDISGDILGGDVGLAISNCILLTGMLQWGVRQSAEVGTQLIDI